MAQQHYDGKKHNKNAARAVLLEQLGKTLDMGEMKGTEQGRPEADQITWQSLSLFQTCVHTRSSSLPPPLTPTP